MTTSKNEMLPNYGNFCPLTKDIQRMAPKKQINLVLLTIFLTGRLFALTFDPVFANNMVLQREIPLTISGTAPAGEKVCITISNITAECVADENQHFQVKLPPLPAGGAYRLEASAQGKKIVLDNVMIGEVWLCAGQSNMHWPLSKTLHGATAIATADNPYLRFCKIPFRSSAKPIPLPAQEWHSCSPETVKDFSAVAYHFAETLQAELGVAIGVIQCTFGGTPAEAWISRDYLNHNPRWKHLTDAFEEDCRNYETNLKAYKETIANWVQKRDEAIKRGEKPQPRPPVREPRGLETFDAIGGAWNAMIFPLKDFDFRGVLWYQGESNQSRGWDYRELFPSLIQEWRRHFGKAELPFLFVQISTQMAPFKEANKQSSHAELRESQEIAARTLPKVGMVTAIDVGDDDHNIHPKNKKKVGERLSNLALYQVYAKEIFRPLAIYPAFRRFDIQDDKFIIELSDSHGLHTADGQPPANFQIAGKDRRYHWAQATIDGDKLTVWAPGIGQPVAVRYCWSHSYEIRPNLYNGAGMPVLPFRTEPFPNRSKAKD